MKLNCLSPYFIKYDESELDSVSIDLYVYTGTKTASRPLTPTYVLSSTAIDEVSVFEISEFIKDFFDFNYTNAPYSNVVWVDYVATRIVDGVIQTSDALVSLAGFYGYGYFMENANPQNESAILMSNRTIVKDEQETLFIPIDSNIATRVSFLENGYLLYSEAIASAPTTSNNYIKYISSGILGVNSFKERVLLDSGIYEGNECSEAKIDCYFLDDTTDIVVEISDKKEVVKIEEGKIEKFKPNSVVFINKFGAFQKINFFGATEVTKSNSKTSYNRNTLNYSLGSYDDSIHVKKSSLESSSESWKLNSGYYKEEFNEVFSQLLDSDFVWLNVDDKNVPVNVSSTSLPYKTQINDNLISYEITFDLAFNKINNVR